MHNLSRRRFLGWTSAGAVGAGLLALAPRLAVRNAEPAPAPSAGTASRAPAPVVDAPALLNGEPIVAFTHDPSSGQLSLMVGTSEVTIHDPGLVARLSQLAAGAR
ncbi:MAG: twin-arginine translocation signal domain-containing protein [Chloroflexota bacterium]|nr:twin-arginine translocation signal domain-containing protein [Chloroflexota bacterium]